MQILQIVHLHFGYAVAQLVEACATSRKVAGSILDGITEIIIYIIIQLLTEMSTRNISWGVKTVGA